MKMFSMAALLVTTTALAQPTARLSGPAGEECGNAADFAGGVISDALVAGSVRLEWTALETSAIVGYRILRSDCRQWRRCSTLVAEVEATSTVALEKAYALTDVAPPGIWTYHLVVRRAHRPPCVARTVVEVASQPPCDAAILCEQLQDTLTANVTDSGTELAWASSAEGLISGYRISRHACDAPSRCSVDVAVVSAAGECGEVRAHALTETPPAGSWRYRLTPIGVAGAIGCFVEVVPE